MLVRLIILFLTLAGCACHADTEINSKIDPECLVGKARILDANGFTGPLICDATKGTADFRHVGTVVTTNGKFEIYDYRYSYRPSTAEVNHGGQRVLIFADSKYLGQISLSPPPYLSISVEGTSILFTGDGDESDRVDLAKGLPNVVYIDGENHRLSR